MIFVLVMMISGKVTFILWKPVEPHQTFVQRPIVIDLNPDAPVGMCSYVVHEKGVDKDIGRKPKGRVFDINVWLATNRQHDWDFETPSPIKENHWLRGE